jgi:hypothetical protein
MSERQQALLAANTLDGRCIVCGHDVSDHGLGCPLLAEVRAMSDPTPTDVQQLIDRLRETRGAADIGTHWDGCWEDRKHYACRERKAADALTALRLDVARSAFAEVSGWFPSTSLMREIWNDDQLERMALTLDLWNPPSTGPRWARLLYLRERQDGKEHAK